MDSWPCCPAKAPARTDFGGRGCQRARRRVSGRRRRPVAIWWRISACSDATDQGRARGFLRGWEVKWPNALMRPFTRFLLFYS
jgi:hypothetical protein